jgi:hypothetical protein
MAPKYMATLVLPMSFERPLSTVLTSRPEWQEPRHARRLDALIGQPAGTFFEDTFADVIL